MSDKSPALDIDLSQPFSEIDSESLTARLTTLVANAKVCAKSHPRLCLLRASSPMAHPRVVPAVLLVSCILAASFARAEAAQASASISNGVTEFGQVSFSQTSSSSPTGIQIALFNLPENTSSIYINTFPVTNATGTFSCSLAGPIFNPFEVSDSYVCTNNSAPSQCKVGAISDRYNLVITQNWTIAGNDTNLPMFGTRRIQGRSVTLTDADGEVLACGNIGSPYCSSNQYQESDIMETSARVCKTYTLCNEFDEYETVEPTPTSDRTCVDIPRDAKIVMTITDFDKAQFLDIEDSFTDGLEQIADGTAKISQRKNVESTSSSRRRAIDYDLNVTFAIIDSLANEPVDRDDVLADLDAAAAQTDCFTQETLDCRCTSDGMSGDVNVTVNGCLDIDGDSVCFVAGGTNCTSATNATAYNATAFPVAGAAFKPCPAIYPETQTCLEYLLTLPVGVTIAQYSKVSPAPSADDIDVPAIPGSRVNDTRLDLTDVSVQYLENFAVFWRQLISKGFPFEAVKYQISYYRDNDDFDMDRLQSDGIDYGLPFAIMAGISVLLFLFLPLVMMIMCCCRCCSCCCCHECCGGRSVHRDPTAMGFLCNGFWLFAAATVMLVFAAGLYLADEQLNSALVDTENAALGAIDNIDLFVDGTLDQIEAIPSQILDVMEQSIIELVDTINSDVSLQIQFLVANATTGALSTLRILATSVDTNFDSVETIQNLTDELIASVQRLDAQGQYLAGNVSDLDTECANVQAAASGGRQAAFTTACNFINPFTWSSDIDYSAVPDLSTELSSLQNIRDQDLSGMADQGEEEFENLPFFLDNKTEEFKVEIVAELDSIRQTIDNETTDIREQVDDAVYDSINLNDTRQTIIDAFDEQYVQYYDEYRSLFSLIVAAIFIAMSSGTLIILFCGCCIYEGPDAVPPTQRSSCSNCAGNLLIAICVGTVFLTLLANLILIIIMPLSNFTGDTCDAIKSDKVFTEIVDDFDTWNEYFLGSAIVDDPTYPLTAKSVLDACRVDQTIYLAAQIELSPQINISDLLSLDTQFNVTELLGDINLNDVELIPDDSLTELESYRDLDLASIDFQAFRDQLQANLSSVNTTALESSILSAISALETLFQNDPNDPPTLGQLLSNAYETYYLLTNVTAAIHEVDTRRNEQVVAVDQLEADVSTLESDINAFLNDVDGLNIYFDSLQDSLIDFDDIDQSVRDILNFFENVTFSLLEEDIGRCQVLSDIYDNMVDATCGETQKGLDAWWISLAMISFSSIFLIIFSIRMARFFRRMKEDDSVFPFDDEMDFDEDKLTRSDNEFEMRPIAVDSFPPPAVYPADLPGTPKYQDMYPPPGDVPLQRDLYPQYSGQDVPPLVTQPSSQFADPPPQYDANDGYQAYMGDTQF